MLLFGDIMISTHEDQVWRCLADPARRQILDLLSDGPKTTGELVTCLDHLCRTAVMKHLELLVKADLVVVSRQGRMRWNCINPVPLATICERWLTPHTKRMTRSLAQLKKLVESPLDT